MLHPDLRLGRSSFGKTIVASAPLPKGTVAWLPCEKCKIHTQEELEALETKQAEELEELGYYLHDGRVVMPCGDAAYFNHSCDAQVLEFQLGFGVVVKDIREGDEVFVDYRMFTHEPEWSFECRCGAENCCKTLNSKSGISAELRREWIRRVRPVEPLVADVPQALHDVALRCAAVYRDIVEYGGRRRGGRVVRPSFIDAPPRGADNA